MALPRSHVCASNTVNVLSQYLTTWLNRRAASRNPGLDTPSVSFHDIALPELPTLFRMRHWPVGDWALEGQAIFHIIEDSDNASTEYIGFGQSRGGSGALPQPVVVDSLPGAEALRTRYAITAFDGDLSLASAPFSASPGTPATLQATVTLDGRPECPNPPARQLVIDITKCRWRAKSAAEAQQPLRPIRLPHLGRPAAGAGPVKPAAQPRPAARVSLVVQRPEVGDDDSTWFPAHMLKGPGRKGEDKGATPAAKRSPQAQNPAGSGRKKIKKEGHALAAGAQAFVDGATPVKTATPPDQCMQNLRRLSQQLMQTPGSSMSLQASAGRQAPSAGGSQPSKAALQAGATGHPGWPNAAAAPAGPQGPGFAAGGGVAGDATSVPRSKRPLVEGVQAQSTPRLAGSQTGRRQGAAVPPARRQPSKAARRGSGRPVGALAARAAAGQAEAARRQSSAAAGERVAVQIRPDGDRVQVVLKVTQGLEPRGAGAGDGRGSAPMGHQVSGDTQHRVSCTGPGGSAEEECAVNVCLLAAPDGYVYVGIAERGSGDPDGDDEAADADRRAMETDLTLSNGSAPAGPASKDGRCRPSGSAEGAPCGSGECDGGTTSCQMAEDDSGRGSGGSGGQGVVAPCMPCTVNGAARQQLQSGHGIDGCGMQAEGLHCSRRQKLSGGDYLQVGAPVAATGAQPMKSIVKHAAGKAAQPGVIDLVDSSDDESGSVAAGRLGKRGRAEPRDRWGVQRHALPNRVFQRHAHDMNQRYQRFRPGALHACARLGAGLVNRR